MELKVNAQVRGASYFLIASVLLLLFFLLQQSLWKGTQDLHTFAEVFALTLSFFVGIIALIRYYSKKTVLFLFVAVGFLGASFLDGYHAFVTASIFSDLFPSTLPSLTSWSWLGSRIFLAASMFLAWVFFVFESKNKNKEGISDKFVFLTGAVFLGIATLFFIFVPLPRAYYPELIFSRPQELVVALLFLWALVGFLIKGDWKKEVFDSWLIIFLIVSFFLQVPYMATSAQPYDAMFDFAHILKVISYGAVLTGLLINTYQLFVRERKSSESLLEKTKQLTLEKQRADKAVKEIQEREQEVANALAESNKAKFALSNILEDLQIERERLNKATSRLELATKAGNLGVWEHDLKKDVFTGDQRTTEILGLPKGVALTIEQILLKVGKEDKEPLAKLYQKTMAGEQENIDYIFKLSEKGSKDKYLQIFGLLQRDEGEAPVRMVGVIMDVTRERLVDQAKTEFVSLASHQLRTPLSTIAWYTEMLLDGDVGKLTPDQRKYMDEVYKGNQRMIGLVNSLLNVSRIELGTFAVDPENVNAEELAKVVIGEIAPSAKRKNIKIEIDCQKGIEDISADPKLLHIVFTNFLTNAVKYTPIEGKISLVLKQAARGDVVGGTKALKKSLYIEVKDTGYGIPKDQHHQVFQKLFRADNIQKLDTEGTGLGLYIVKAIVEEAKGKVWFSSEEDKGTTFSVLIPYDGMKKKDGTRKLT